MPKWWHPRACLPRHPNPAADLTNELREGEERRSQGYGVRTQQLEPLIQWVCQSSLEQNPQSRCKGHGPLIGLQHKHASRACNILSSVHLFPGRMLILPVRTGTSWRFSISGCGVCMLFAGNPARYKGSLLRGRTRARTPGSARMSRLWKTLSVGYSGKSGRVCAYSE